MVPAEMPPRSARQRDGVIADRGGVAATRGRAPTLKSEVERWRALQGRLRRQRRLGTHPVDHACLLSCECTVAMLAATGSSVIFGWRTTIWIDSLQCMFPVSTLSMCGLSEWPKCSVPPALGHKNTLRCRYTVGKVDLT
eukprot:364774-Chlamydomonas_euryale.AAC.4